MSKHIIAETVLSSGIMKCNIVTEALRIGHWHALFCLLHYVYERTGRFIETWLGEAIGNIDPNEYTFRLCILKWDWSTTDNRWGRISDVGIQNLNNLRCFHEVWKYGWVQKNYFSVRPGHQHHIVNGRWHATFNGRTGMPLACNVPVSSYCGLMSVV